MTSGETRMRPAHLTDEHLQYLDRLREIGSHNMAGAGQYIWERFPELGRIEAREIGAYWMATFGERHGL
jgi:hypothetical protein